MNSEFYRDYLTKNFTLFNESRTFEKKRRIKLI
jgi:hypothetical protein